MPLSWWLLFNCIHTLYIELLIGFTWNLILTWNCFYRALHNSLPFLFCENLFGCVGLKLNVTPSHSICFQFCYGTAHLQICGDLWAYHSLEIWAALANSWLCRHEKDAINPQVQLWLVHQALHAEDAEGWLRNCGYLWSHKTLHDSIYYEVKLVNIIMVVSLDNKSD